MVKKDRPDVPGAFIPGRERSVVWTVLSAQANLGLCLLYTFVFLNSDEKCQY